MTADEAAGRVRRRGRRTGEHRSDWSNFESWEERGSLDTAQRANALVKKILAEFEPPPLDETRHEALAEFVERRKREGGAPTDY